MTERALRLSHRLVRVIAMITLIGLGVTLACERYSSTHCHALANSWLGMILTFWTIAMSLLLPLYVGFEGWWMRKIKVGSKDLWIDAGLAIGCFLSLLSIVLYALTHYAMF
jgi:hypothetical protein